jgi:hypothetical protein
VRDVRLLVRDAHHLDVAGTVLLQDVPDSRAWLVVALTPAECAQAATVVDAVLPVSSAAVSAEVLVGQPVKAASTQAPPQPDAESSDEMAVARPVVSG